MPGVEELETFDEGIEDVGHTFQSKHEPATAVHLTTCMRVKQSQWRCESTSLDLQWRQ